MRWLKKINKGFILTMIVLICLVIYLISVEVTRGAEKPNIEAACKEYIEFINKAIVSKDENLKQKLEEKMIDNEIAINMQKDTIESFIKDGNNIPNSSITKFDKELAKIKKFVFDDNQVTITITSKVEEEIKYLDEENKEKSKIQKIETGEETITLQKVEGKWKIVYADLQYADYSGGYSASTIVSF